MDTFVVIFGVQTDDFKVKTIGLIDYLCLGAFLCLHQMFLDAFKNYKKSLQSFLFFVLCFLLNLAGWIIRLGCSLLLSALCLPIVALCHGLSKLLGGAHLESLAFNISGQDKSSRNAAVELISLKDFLLKHHKKVDDLNAELAFSKKTAMTHIYEKTKNVGGAVIGLFSRGKIEEFDKQEIQEDLFSKLTLTYVYIEEKPWFSNAAFLYFSVMLSALLPCLAIYTAPTITQSATERLSQVVNGLPKDVFEINIDPKNVAQQQQLSAMFALNLANVLQTLFETCAEDELLTKERQRLQKL